MTLNNPQYTGTPALDTPSEPTVHPVITDRLAQLKALIPEAFSDDTLNVDALRVALGEQVASGPERYGFSFAGKRDARQALQTPAQGTLHPAPGEGVAEDTAPHAFIEGDNLEVLKLLYRSYAGAIKLIYIDPPYNTGNDFVYPDNFAEPLQQYLKMTGQADANGKLLTSATDRNGGGHRHSHWMRMMYPRLFMARQLLRDDGVIFISIDDNEVHNLRLLMNEIFGEENFLAQVVWQKVYSPRMDAKGYSADHDYILVYQHSDQHQIGRVAFEQNLKQFSGVDQTTGKQYRPRSLRKEGKNSRRVDRPNLFYPITAPDGSTVLPIRSDGSEGCWRWSQNRYEAAQEAGAIQWEQTKNGWQVYVKQFYDEEAVRPPSTLWLHTDVGHNHEAVEAR